MTLTIGFDINNPSCSNCGSAHHWMLIPHRLHYEFTCLVCGFEETFLLDEVVVKLATVSEDDDAELVEGAA